MLAADEELANKIMEIAKRRGQTVFQTVNDILEQAINADAMGLVLSEIMKDREILERAKRTGFTFTIEKLLYDLVDVAFEKAKDEISRLWLETGRWYGRYFFKRSNEGINEFREAMSLLTFGSSDLKVDTNKEGELLVACVGEKFTQGFTDALSLLIEGVFDAFGFDLKGKESSKGVIRLKFVKSR